MENLINQDRTCEPISASAVVQVDTRSPNFVIQEANQGPLHKTIFKAPLVFENGYIIPPSGPSLGVELDPDVVKAHLIE